MRATHAAVVGHGVEPEDPHRARRRRAGSPRGSRRSRSCPPRSAPAARATWPRSGRQRQAVHRRGGAVAHHEVAAFDGRAAAGGAREGRAGHRGEATVAPHDRHPPGQGEPRRGEGRPGPPGGRPRRGRAPPRRRSVGPARPWGARDELRGQVKDLSRQVGEARRTGDATPGRGRWPSRAAPWARRRPPSTPRPSAAQAEVRELLLWLPNLPSPEAPDGDGPERQRRGAAVARRRRAPTPSTSACRTGTWVPRSASSTSSGAPSCRARCSRSTAASGPGSSGR